MRWSKKGKADQHMASDVVKLVESLHGAERLSATTRFQCLEVLFASVPGHERAQVRSTKRSSVSRENHRRAIGRFSQKGDWWPKRLLLGVTATTFSLPHLGEKAVQSLGDSA